MQTNEINMPFLIIENILNSEEDEILAFNIKKKNTPVLTNVFYIIFLVLTFTGVIDILSNIDTFQTHGINYVNVATTLIFAICSVSAFVFLPKSQNKKIRNNYKNNILKSKPLSYQFFKDNIVIDSSIMRRKILVTDIDNVFANEQIYIFVTQGETTFYILKKHLNDEDNTMLHEYLKYAFASKYRVLKPKGVFKR